MRKRVLVVCMMNSVHSAKWLAQFKNSDIDFFIFPSSYFKRIHPLLNSLIRTNSKATYSIQYKFLLPGLLDYFQERFLRPFLSFYSRKSRLNRYILRTSPHVVHALEFQHSAYLCSQLIDEIGKTYIFIATNWGSDIYHFMNFPDHNARIRQVLRFADKYSAECDRDVELAIRMGFNGNFLPTFPNAGGFELEEILKKRSKTSSRRLIIVKGYGGYFGRVKIAIDALNLLLKDHSEYSVFFYSVTQDVQNEIDGLRVRFGDRIKYSTVQRPMDYEKLQEIFSQARIYLGCSISDGISTSFLESLVAGAYPIQTVTSCANEWINKGADATLVKLDVEEIRNAIEFALINDEFVDTAQAKNMAVAKTFLNNTNIRLQALSFYS